MNYQIISAERPDAESQLSAVLNHLREIDAQIPIEAKLPGSPTLTDQMAYLLKKYLELRKELATAKARADELNDAIGEALHTLGVDPGDWSGGVVGIKAAIAGNLAIGGDTYKTRENWADDETKLIGTITGRLFDLVEQIEKLKAVQS